MVGRIETSDQIAESELIERCVRCIKLIILKGKKEEMSTRLESRKKKKKFSIKFAKATAAPFKGA